MNSYAAQRQSTIKNNDNAFSPHVFIHNECVCVDMSVCVCVCVCECNHTIFVTRYFPLEAYKVNEYTATGRIECEERENGEKVK